MFAFILILLKLIFNLDTYELVPWIRCVASFIQKIQCLSSFAIGIKCRCIKCVWDYVSPGLIVAVLSDVGIKCPVSTVTVLSVTVLNVVLP